LDIEKFIAAHRVGRLATVSPSQEPHIVPVVYAYDGEHVYVVLDEKPKSLPPPRLKRVRNIESNARVSLLIDEYDEDWSKLAWVRIDGIARILSHADTTTRAIELLRAKYSQYRKMELTDKPVIEITIKKKAHWEATRG
jgi:PPOX class probable F420-dependent enzyme